MRPMIILDSLADESDGTNSKRASVQAAPDDFEAVPTVKCSDCGDQIPLSALEEHICQPMSRSTSNMSDFGYTRPAARDVPPELESDRGSIVESISNTSINDPSEFTRKPPSQLPEDIVQENQDMRASLFAPAMAEEVLESPQDSPLVPDFPVPPGRPTPAPIEVSRTASVGSPSSQRKVSTPDYPVTAARRRVGRRRWARLCHRGSTM